MDEVELIFSGVVACASTWGEAREVLKARYLPDREFSRSSINEALKLLKEYYRE